MNTVSLPQKPGVYYFRQLSTNKLYIGGSKDLRARCSNHISTLTTGKHSNHNLQEAWDQAMLTGKGSKDFVFGIFEMVGEISQLPQRETFYIRKYSKSGRLFNVTGNRFPSEQRAKSKAKIKSRQRVEVAKIKRLSNKVAKGKMTQKAMDEIMEACYRRWEMEYR